MSATPLLTTELAPGLAAGVVAPDVSVIIVSWNDWDKLRVCLASLAPSLEPGLAPAGGVTSEIIVIDNASADGTPEQVQSRFPAIRLERCATNIGHTKAINLGMRLVRGRYVLLLDSDTELLGDCLARLHGFLESRPDVAVVAPRTLNTDGSIQESARNFPTPLGGLFGRQSLLTRLFPNNSISRRYLQRDFLHATEPFEVQQIGGACMFFRRELITQVGGWDERYFGYWVDTDWCHQLARAGKRIFCLPAARLRHDESNARGKRKSVRRIWVFHVGAWQLYTRWHCLGYWDPRSVIAGLALAARAGLKIGLNALPRRVAAPGADFAAAQRPASRRAQG